MTLGLSDSLSLTLAAVLNTRVGYSSRPSPSPRSVVWNDKQPEERRARDERVICRK